VRGELEEEGMYVNHVLQHNYVHTANPLVEHSNSSADRPTPTFALQFPIPDAEKSPIPGKSMETATPSEIGKLHNHSTLRKDMLTFQAELISLGTTALRTPPTQLTTAHLLLARHYFSKALFFLRLDQSTPPKRVSRVCQKLLETCLLLSQLARQLPERKTHADKAQEFGEAALENVVMCGDRCMVAQVEFKLACVTAWKVYLGMKSGGNEEAGRNGVRLLMERRVEGLRGFGNVEIGWYEEQARVYLGYLK
jgi:hypothetical protein